ncbi:SdpI family protein [Mycobacterium sp.]|uniref:SdpI family protein n=1 Tax=Mycobacterium sp. TaxID=1785 RepID=UPI003D0AE124
MEAERLVLASFIAITFVFLTALIIAIDWAAVKGHLRRNQFVGIRTSSTMRSDQAWVAGHRAALRLTPLHLVTGVSLVIGVFSAQSFAGLNLVGVCGAVVFVLVAAFTAVIAGRAAKAAEEDSDR